MTSLKLLYRRGVPAALLLGLIVGAPDIAQAFTQLRGGGRQILTVPPSGIPPRSSSMTTFGGPPRPAIPPRTSSIPATPPPAFPPSYAPTTKSVGTQTDKSGIGRGSRIISTEGGPEGSESEGDSPL